MFEVDEFEGEVMLVLVELEVVIVVGDYLCVDEGFECVGDGWSEGGWIDFYFVDDEGLVDVWVVLFVDDFDEFGFEVVLSSWIGEF